MNIGIVGLGLIGGSYAKSLKKYGYKIYGMDTNQHAIDYALEHNIIDIGDINKLIELQFEIGSICDTSAIDGVLHFFPRGNA